MKERISWTSKDGTHLYGVTRGVDGTTATAFASNASLCNATLLVFATDVALNPATGYLDVGSERIWHEGLTQVGTVYHCDIATRGADGTTMYAHGPGAPVYDPIYNINNPATGTSVATYGVRSDTAYAGSALDRNTLDIYALKQLNEKKDALEYGQMIYTGLDVWQNATYGHMKSASFTCPATDVGIFTINLHRATGTDTVTDVYLGENVKESFWDVRFRLSNVTGTHLQHSLTTSATDTAVATVMITSPPTVGTLDLYYGSLWAVDYSTMFATSSLTSLTCATMATDTASTYNINDRGIVNVNCGDIFTLEETEGATAAWMVSGLEYDQSAGKLTVTYGVVEETALEMMSRNSEAFDIANDIR